jgi:hypothetical protein
MDEMPIQCPWESVGVGFFAIVAVDSKKGIGLDEVLAEIHEANHLQVPTIVHQPLYSPFL